MIDELLGNSAKASEKRNLAKARFLQIKKDFPSKDHQEFHCFRILLF